MLTASRRIRSTALVLVGALMLTSFEAASAAAAHHLPRRMDRLIHPSAPHRRAGGASYTTLTTAPFKVDGSPYFWSLEASQYRPGPGSPPSDPNLRVIADRAAPSGTHPEQVHIWEFDLPAGSLQFDAQLRHVGLDTGLIPGYGAIFMDLEGLGPITRSKDRCPKTGALLTTRSRRRGMLRGSMTFFPGYSDPQMPSDVNISHVRATIERDKYTDNPCPFGTTCDVGRTFDGLQPVGMGGYIIDAFSSREENALVLQEQEQVGVAVVTHLLFAFGDPEVITATPTQVEILSDIGQPFVQPGGTMTYTKGAKVVATGPHCKRTTWTLTGPMGSFDFTLDSGDQTLAAPTTAQFEVAKRR